MRGDAEMNKTDKIPARGDAGREKTGFLSGALVVAAALLVPHHASAEAWVVTPRLMLKTGHEDNIRFSPVNEDSGFETVADLSASIRRVTEISEIKAELKANFIDYDKTKNLDKEENQFARFSASYNLNELSKIGTNVGFDRQITSTTQRFEGDDIEDGEPIDTDTALTRQQIRRETLRVQPFWEASIGERTWMRVQYTYRDVSYGSGANDPTVSLNDYTQKRLTTMFGYSSTETRTYTLALEAGNYDVDGSDQESDDYAVRVGMRHNYSETAYVGGNIGASYVEFENNDVNNDTGMVFEVYAGKRTELTSYRVSIGRSLQPSGNSDMLESDTINLRAVHQLSPRLDVSLRASYFSNSTIAAGKDSLKRSDRDYYRVEPSINWNMTPEWKIGFSYRYREEDRDNYQNTVDSNGVFLTLTYQKKSEI
jgi:hypothetical protein